jgi:hypothetical protein
MSRALLDPPPSRAEPVRDAGAAGRPRPRRRIDGRVFLAALVLSALGHLLLVLVFRFEPGPPRGTVRPVTTPAELPGMRVVQIVPVDEPAVGADRPEDEERRERTDAAVPVAPRAATPATPPVAPADGRAIAPTVRERIETRLGDRRIWVRAEELLPPPVSAEEAALARIEGRFSTLADSLAAEAAAAERALDWTVRDGSGGRWGVSPQGLHLGGVTVPIPFQFSTPPGRRDEMTDRVRRWGEIERQAGQADVNDTFEDRVRAIRERTQAQRDSARRSGGN